MHRLGCQVDCVGGHQGENGQFYNSARVPLTFGASSRRHGGKKIKANWSHIEEQRIDVTRLSALVKSDAQGDSYVVISSCPSQLMDKVKALVKGNRNVMASWAIENDFSSLDQIVANISLESVNTPTVISLTPSWLFEGGADGAIENFKRVFGKAPQAFFDGNNDLYLSESDCNTIEKQNAVARMLATDAPVKGWNGRLFLQNNNIGDEGANFIGEGVKHSTSLTTLYLPLINLTDATKEQLQQVCSARNIAMW